MTIANNYRGKFISVEGIEGVGKSTYMPVIADYLQQQQIKVVVTREPGGTVFADKIRALLLDNHQEVIHADTELLLMFAARAQHIAEVIKPALMAGQWVVSDRFSDASYAYQGAGRGINKQRIQALEHWVQGSLRPDMTLLFDAPIDVALQRMQQRGKLDRIESEGKDFFQRIRDAYLAMSQIEPERFFVLDTRQSINNIKQQLIKLLQNYLQKNSQR
ncbi:MAG: dTMP kinase [Gammaproteobacteria bacterium]|nr:dTMP kinase [Gammaproteobacteria bacterium]